MKNTLAPIVLFTYNRPLHTQQVLDSLSKNAEAKDSILYIYCDGLKHNPADEDLNKIDAVRTIIKNENRFKQIITVIAEENKGLENSIIDGVTNVINTHGKVIVLEDDLIVSPFFIAYMNDSLDRYENNLEVGQIGACNFFACGKNYPNYFFVPLPDCWGWATWKNRWDFFNPNIEELSLELNKNEDKAYVFNAYGAFDFMGMLYDQIKNKSTSWDVRWQAVCVLKGWLTLYPNLSMSNHIESEDATHVNKNIIPPMVTTAPVFYSVDVKEVSKVIKAFKLGYSKKGDYFGRRKKKTTKEKIRRVKRMIRPFIPSFVINLWKNFKK
ncbi:hypothetical protein [Flavobacterium marginilacus]|uniref:hypothetical protein n=1 Tax=Flavobacterium marginilacus TaxID=3003256 RepID=UPI00248E125C|nr:hypothetical protein [Flavobacterium marginilacus]